MISSLFLHHHHIYYYFFIFIILLHSECSEEMSNWHSFGSSYQEQFSESSSEWGEVVFRKKEVGMIDRQGRQPSGNSASRQLRRRSLESCGLPGFTQTHCQGRQHSESKGPPLTLMGEEGTFLEGQCRDSLRNRWVLLQPEKRVEVKFKGWCD